MLSRILERCRTWRTPALVLAATGLTALTAQAQFNAQNVNFPTASSGVSEIAVVSSTAVWATAYDGSGSSAALRDLSITTNGGTTWTPRTVPANTSYTFADISAVSATTAWVAMVNTTSGGGQIFKTTNGGASWTQQLSSGYTQSGSYLDCIHMFSATNGVVVGDPVLGEFEIYRTTNGGTSWTAVPNANKPDAQTGEYGLLRMMRGNNNQQVCFGTNKGRVYRSTNGGLNWTVSATGLSQVNQMAFSTNNDGLALEYDANGGFVGMACTRDGGASWFSINPTGIVYTGDLQAIPSLPGYYISASPFTSASGTSYTTDYGQTWTTIETGVQRTAIGGADANHIWAGSYTSSTHTGGIFFGPLPGSANPLGNPPSWSWAKKLANTNDDAALADATDASGNVYVAGYFSGSITLGSTTLNSNGGVDGYLAKYSPSGALLWAKNIGGTTSDQMRAVCTDASGNVFVAGYTTGNISFGSFSVSAGSLPNFFIARINPANGQPVWIKSEGGAGTEYVNDIEADNVGYIYVAGSYDGQSKFDALGNFCTPVGGEDGVVVKYAINGNYQWVYPVGGDADDPITGIGAVESGGVIIGGTFGTSVGSTIHIGPTTTLTSVDGTDGYMAYIQENGTLWYANRFGGTGEDGVYGVTCDQYGHAVLAAYFSQSMVFAGVTVAPLTTTGTSSVVLGYTGSNEAWSSVTGGSLSAAAYNVTKDATGNYYAVGVFQGTASFSSASLTSAGSTDIYVTKYDNNGQMQWVTSAGGAGQDQGMALAVDASGNVYVAGVFTTSSLRLGSNTLSASGGTDGFLGKLGTTTCTLSTPTLTSNSPVCVGQLLTLTGGNVDAGTTVRITGPNNFSTSSANGQINAATAAAGGTYTIVVTSTAQACSTSATTSVVVNAVPSPPTVGDASICTPSSVTLTAGNVPSGATVEWYTTTGSTPLYTGNPYNTPVLSAATSYVVRVRSAQGCVSTGNRITVNYITLSTPSITAQVQGGGVLLTSSSVSGNQWFRNGNAIPGATGQTLYVNDPANNGIYTVQVSANDCTSPMSAGSVVTITGLADGLASLKLTVAPNPTTDGRTLLKLAGARSGETVRIRVLDALGRSVYTGSAVSEAGETHHLLDLSVLPQGIYTVRVAAAGRVLTQPMVRE